MLRLRLISLLACGCLALSACATRPSEEDLAEAILAATNAEPTISLSTEQASCIARELLATDLSDTTLSGLAEDFDEPEVLQTEIDDVEPAVAGAALVCQ